MCVGLLTFPLENLFKRYFNLPDVRPLALLIFIIICHIRKGDGDLTREYIVDCFY